MRRWRRGFDGSSGPGGLRPVNTKTPRANFLHQGRRKMVQGFEIGLHFTDVGDN